MAGLQCGARSLGFFYRFVGPVTLVIGRYTTLIAPRVPTVAL